MIKTMQECVDFGSWKDVQDKSCDFADRRLTQAPDNSVTIDMDEYIENMTGLRIETRTSQEHRAL